MPPAPPKTPREPFRRDGDQLWRRFVPVLWLFLLLLGVSILMIAYVRVTGNESPWVELAVTLADAAIIVAFCLTERRSIGGALRGFGFQGAGLLLPVAVLVWMVAFMTAYLAALEAIGVEPLSYLEDYRGYGWPLWSAFVLIAVCPAIFEELAFRGFIQGRLERVVTGNEALLIQAAMFSVLHLLPLVFVSHFLLGIALGWLRRKSGSLYPGMLAHGCFNALILVGEMHGF